MKNENQHLLRRLESFPPVVDCKTHTLILGSMPGKISLSAFQYYAHPRNAFWHIMAELFHAGFDLPYEQRLSQLLKNGIGLWDVIGNCTRATSLDADIDENSISANDFSYLLARYRSINTILFNGTKAEQAFSKYVRPHLDDLLVNIRMQRLISTSPANARYSIDDKIAIWKTALHN